MQKLVLSGIFLFLIVFPSYAFADGPYLNIPPTNAFDKIHTDSGTVSASNFSMPVNIIGGTGITVSGNNGTHTITITNTGSSGSTTKGTYNQTYANNVLVNSLGNRINFLNGTNSTINVVDDPTRNQVNVTISSTGGSGTSGVSSLNALTGALTIACVAGNTTCTTSGGNTITINTAYNIATLNLNEIFSGITTMNNLKLGGQMNINGQTMQSFGHTYSWQNHTGTVCLTNQTTSCGPAGSATYDTLVNIGTGEASVYAGNTTKTNFTFKTLKQGSHITLTNNTNDVTIATTGLLSSALLSLNNDTTSAQILRVIGSGSIADSGSGIHTITTKTYQNNTGGNLGTHGIGPFASMNAQVLQFLSLVSANSNCAFTNNSTNLILTCSTPPSITSVNSQTGPSISIVRELGNTTITNSTNQIKVGLGVNPVITGGAAQTITKPIKLNQLNASSSLVDNNDNTKKLTWLLSGMTTGKTLTVRSNQTTSQGLNIPNISGTDTLGTLGLSQIWTGANTYSPTTTQGIIMNPPTVPVGSSTSFTGNIKQNNSTTAFATNPETGDYASNNFGQVTLTNPSSGTIPVAATLEIAGAPIAGSNVIITNPFALLVDSGTSRFGGDIYGIGKWNINSNTNANNDILNVNDNYGITSIVGFYTQAVHNIYYSAGWKSRQGGPGGLIEMDGGASQGQGMLFQLTNGTTGTAKGHPLTLSTILGLGTTGVSNFLGVNTAGLGIQPIYNATNQKSESGADPNVLTYTPPATKGNYEIKITMSVSAASSATLGWTASWKDSNGHAQAPTNLSLTKSGTAAPALTFTAAANDVYYAVLPIDTDNSATKIIVKTTFAGTSTAYKVSATIEQIQ